MSHNDTGVRVVSDPGNVSLSSNRNQPNDNLFDEVRTGDGATNSRQDIIVEEACADLSKLLHLKVVLAAAAIFNQIAMIEEDRMVLVKATKLGMETTENCRAFVTLIPSEVQMVMSVEDH
ncbi:unnamed protein product [Phytophthora fragariaefolia]|uniref:Unnamed protein product n=1 Tax=Phytophthora fragariaefolia TaxID=1490495 RepID=A0A9W6XMF8_9STRA|nr:unnamed protein product [Phytophthora fragariaefolia]